MVNRSFLHTNAVQNMVPVVEEHGNKSLSYLPANIFFEITNGIVRGSYYRASFVFGPGFCPANGGNRRGDLEHHFQFHFGLPCLCSHRYYSLNLLEERAPSGCAPSKIRGGAKGGVLRRSFSRIRGKDKTSLRPE